MKGAGKALGLVSFLFLIIIFAVNFYYIDSFHDPSAKRVLLFSALYVTIPALFLPSVIWISDKVSLLKSIRNLLLHIVLSVIYVAMFVFLVQFIRSLVDGYFLFGEGLEIALSILRRQFLLSGSMAFLLYWGIAVLSGMQVYYREVSEVSERANKLESQLSSATLSTLKAQLKPHFLFNTLNMVDYLIHTDHKKAIDTLNKLEGLIKSTFDQHQPNSCTIEAEIIFLEKYLDIEKSRFQDRLSVQLEIDEDTEHIKIPCYLIQPLVENSVKHGVGKSLKKCTITIKSKLIGDFLSIEVFDDGNGSTKKCVEKVEWGIGLKNIEDRLKIYFGIGAFLEVKALPEGGFKSVIIIPKTKLKGND